ncbi:hypothetical protein KCV03_g9, partial [Aureobasidium melanogenum]
LRLRSSRPRCQTGKAAAHRQQNQSCSQSTVIAIRHQRTEVRPKSVAMSLMSTLWTRRQLCAPRREMQNALQDIQMRYRIYNSEIEPEHDSDYPCACPIHQYQRMKRSRRPVLTQWSEAVMYPGEKVYHDLAPQTTLFSGNPYQLRVTSPYGYGGTAWVQSHPRPNYHVKFIHQTIALNNQLNHEAQAKVDAMEPKHSIWDDKTLESVMANLSVAPEKGAPSSREVDAKSYPAEKASSSNSTPRPNGQPERSNTSRFAAFRKAVGIKSSDERAVAKSEKAINQGIQLRHDILAEEASRWPDDETRQIVAQYQDKVGMERKIAHLRTHQPLQYLHLLRAGYFEPIPVAWADQASSILTFNIEAAGGWRGITPQWRGYEDTAEERLYWVLNHREGPSNVITISPMILATYSILPRDTRSKSCQALSGSMDFDPIRPV